MLRRRSHPTAPESSNGDKPLTPEERRALVEAPLSIRTVGSTRSWSGTGVRFDGLDQQNARQYTYNTRAWHDAYRTEED